MDDPEGSGIHKCFPAGASLSEFMHGSLGPAGLLSPGAGRAEHSWYNGMNKDMRMPMVPFLLQGYLVQMSTERQRLDLIFSENKALPSG